MDIITGYTGKAHVTAEQDRDINIGIFGKGSCVLQTGQQLNAVVISNNEIRITDGVLIHLCCIDQKEYDKFCHNRKWFARNETY